MKKNKALLILIVAVVSIILIYLLSSILLDTKGSVNQGTFRINDFVLKSTLDVEELVSQETETTGFDSMKLNLSERNNISILIAKQKEIKEIYIDNISVSNPSLKGNIAFYQNNEKDELISLEEKKVTILPEEKDGQLFISLNLDNLEFMKDVKIPDGTNAVTFDGTMLKILDMKFSDIQMKFKFNLNIVDETGKLNVCKISLKFPEEDLINNGISITRKSTNDYIFSIEDNYMKKILNKF